MGTARLEDLLEQLVMAVMESNEKLDDILNELRELRQEVDDTNTLSFASGVSNRLDEVTAAVMSVETAISLLG